MVRMGNALAAMPRRRVRTEVVASQSNLLYCLLGLGSLSEPKERP